MTPENTLGDNSSVPITEPMPDPVIDPTVPETPAVNPDPVIDPTAPAEPAPAPVVESTPTPVVDPTTSSEPQALGDDPTKSLDQPATPDASTQAPVVEKPKGNAKIIGIIVAAVVVLALVIVAIIFLPKLFSSVDTAKYDDDAFFAEESNGSNSFAIFKRNGERVTDFIYSNVSSFTDGHAVACLREDANKCGIVTSAGTVSLNFGAYDSITSAGGLYVVTSGNKRTLVNYAGQQISELASSEDANADLFIRDEELPLVIYNYGDNKYKLYNSEGKVLLDFESTSRPTLFHNNQMAIGFMSTDNKTYAIGANDQNIITEANSEYTYTSVKDISGDGKTLIIQTDTQKDKLRHYAIYANDKITPVNSDECTDLIFAEDSNKTKMNYVNCKIKYSEYAVDEKGNITHGDYTTKYLGTNTYIKSEYYQGELDESEDFSGTTYVFFRDGKQARRIAGKSISLGAMAASGYYTFYSYDYRDAANNYRHFRVFNTSGEEVFKYDFDDSNYYNAVYGLDSNGNYIITGRDKDESGKSRTYGMVVKPDGTIVVDKQDSPIREFHGFYLVADYSTIEAILDKNVKQISPDEQTYNSVEAIGDNFIMASKSYQNISHVYSLSGKKLTGDDKSASATAHKNYIAIKEGSKYKYYNVETGEEIYAQ